MEILSRCDSVIQVQSCSSPEPKRFTMPERYKHNVGNLWRNGRQLAPSMNAGWERGREEPRVEEEQEGGEKFSQSAFSSILYYLKYGNSSAAPTQLIRCSIVGKEMQSSIPSLYPENLLNCLIFKQLQSISFYIF